MSKVQETLRDLGIVESSLPAGLSARMMKYDRMLKTLEQARAEVEETGENEKLEQLEEELFEYQEDLIAGLNELSSKRAEKAEQARIREEKKQAREAKKKAQAAKAAPKPEPTPEPESEPERTPEAEPQPAPTPDASSAEGEANASGAEDGEIHEPEIMEEEPKSEGIGLGTILLGGLVLLTTFGAYNYFKRR
jgi:outer membrane biosynthesis protein TonB